MSTAERHCAVFCSRRAIMRGGSRRRCRSMPTRDPRSRRRGRDRRKAGGARGGCRRIRRDGGAAGFMSGSTRSIPSSATAICVAIVRRGSTASSCQRSKAPPVSPRSTGCWRSSTRAQPGAGGIDLIPIIETARVSTGSARSLRRHAGPAGRVRGRRFHARRQHGLEPRRSRAPPARAAIVTASRAAGIEAPLDTVWVDLPDPDGLDASSRNALGFGFQGKMCIHPDQISIVNRVFTPSDEDRLRRARRARPLPRPRPRAARRSSSTASSSTTRSSTGRSGFCGASRRSAQRESGR